MPSTTKLPENVFGLDQLLDELAPGLERKPFRAEGLPSVTGREVRTDDGDHVLTVWREGGRWWSRERQDVRGLFSETPSMPLLTVTMLADILAHMLMVDVVDAEAHLRERARLLRLDQEREQEEEEEASRLAENTALQDAFEAVLTAGVADPQGEPPFDPAEPGYYLALVEEVGEVSEWGPRLAYAPELAALMHNSVPVESGWYVVRVDEPTKTAESVAQWGARCLLPCTLAEVLEGLDEYGEGYDG